MPPVTPRVWPVTAFMDNYVWIAEAPGMVAIVDPGDAAPVQSALQERGLTPTHIVLTHHHWDHTAGVEAIAERWGCAVVGAARDAERLPPLALAVSGGDTFALGESEWRVLDVPGHTSGHVAYVVGGALFAGDALFSIGCGRLFEGTPAEMWSSLSALRGLPDETLLYCGHEYTESNLRFARHLFPDDEALAEAERRAALLRAQDSPTLPTTLGHEKALNPFLRCDDPRLQTVVGLEGAAPDVVFGHVRSRKDSF